MADKRERQRGSRANLPSCAYQPTAYSGLSREEILALRRQYLSPGLFTYYREPICVVEGHMQYVWDDTGKRYLDALAGIATVAVGHCHPAIADRACQQMRQLVHTTTIYLHPTIALFARELAQRMPTDSDLQVTYFANSGSEANDLATMMARLHTGKQHVLALRNGYHGGTQATMALTAIGTWKYPLQAPLEVAHSAPGYCYRCPFGLAYPSCDLKCARSIEDLITYETCGEVACFIAEAIQGVGGVVVPPPEYFQIVYEIVRKHGGLCIADEVQAGLGRTGSAFWGFENWNVTPDMVTTAKGIGNGAPLAACITTPDVAGEMTRRLHFNTFGGNPVSMTQGLAVLEILDEERMQANAREQGAYLRERFEAMAERFELIGEVRGMGLLIGIELVKDRTSKEPAEAEAFEILELARERGLLLGKSGLHSNVLRVTPPLCITRDDCVFLADCLEECFEVVCGGAAAD